MATATSNNSGNWGDDIWDGGSGAGGIPAAGDAVVIAAGHSVLMNYDMSGEAGITTLTITGHDSTTPGMLYFKNGTDGYLKFATGTGNGILGTNNTNKGRLLANSDGVWRGNKGTTVTGSADADTLTAVAHGLTDTTPISFFCDSATDILPAPLKEGVVYYVRDKADNTFKVAATSGGAAINLTTDGTGTFGVNTCLAFANKAIIDFVGTALLTATYLDVALVGFEPINKSVEVYKDAYTCTDQTTDVNTTTDVITFTGAPPAAGTAVMVKSSGTLPGGLTTTDVYYTRTIDGNTCKLATRNADAQIVDITSAGSGTLTMYSGHTDTATKVMAIVQDLTSDGCWITTAGHNTVFLVDANQGDNVDQQRDTLASIDTSAPFGLTITTANVNSAQYPLALVFLSSRNVSIRNSTSTSASQAIVSGASGCCFQCEIIASAGQYCYGLSSSNNNTISGTISGCSSGLSNSNNNTISGTISGCTYGLYSSNNNTISGTISGCTSTSYNGSYGNKLRNSDTTVVMSTNNPSVVGRLSCEDYGRVPGVHKIFDNMGDIIKTACDGTGDAPSVDPDAGNGYCIEASNLQSYCGTEEANGFKNPLLIIEDQRIWLAAGSYTITYKTQNTFTGGISAGELLLTGTYPNASDILTTQTDAPALAIRTNDADWTQTLDISVTMTTDGWLSIKLELMKYESGCEVYIWPEPTIA